MSMPLVYDVLIRAEVQAANELDAVKKIAETIQTFGPVTGIHTAVEVIRDDSLSSSGKDELSRYVNGFAVFSSEQRNKLLHEINAALQAASKGDLTEGNQLMSKLQSRFDYLSNSTLYGVEL